MWIFEKENKSTKIILVISVNIFIKSLDNQFSSEKLCYSRAALINKRLFSPVYLAVLNLIFHIFPNICDSQMVTNQETQSMRDVPECSWVSCSCLVHRKPSWGSNRYTEWTRAFVPIKNIKIFFVENTCLNLSKS